MPRVFLLIFMALLLGWLGSGCQSNDDDNSPPATGTLTGRVIFHGAWPDSGTVQLSLFENWSTDPCSWCGVAPGGPPAYYTAANYFQDPNPNNGEGPDTLSYTLSGITPGTYRAAAVGWRAPVVSNINCDEPVIGLFGADPYLGDSLPEAITFSGTDPVTRDIHAYFTTLPVPGCNARGRIDGTVHLSGEWPSEGLLVMLTTFPVTAWLPLTGQPAGYDRSLSPTDSSFRFTPPFGTYYLSVWTDAAPPAPVQWYGSFGIQTQLGVSGPLVTDARPDTVRIDSLSPRFDDIDINAYAPPPHWISGTVSFTGERPAEGLLVLLSTFPFTPEHPGTGAPTGYFAITDPAETLYALSGMAADTYYVSLWSNDPFSSEPTFYGAYGYTAGSDTDPDPVVIDSTVAAWGVNGVNVTGAP